MKNNDNHDEDWSPILTPIYFFYKLVEWTQGMFKPYLITYWSESNSKTVKNKKNKKNNECNWTSKHVNVIQELIMSFTGFYDWLFFRTDFVCNQNQRIQNILILCCKILHSIEYSFIRTEHEHSLCLSELKNFAYAHH